MDVTGKLHKLAKECHTKSAWENFFRTYREQILKCNSDRTLSEIFRQLRNDHQSLGYDPSIWATLLDSCINSWNLALGKDIAEHTRQLSDVTVSLSTAKIFAENGQPDTARQIAQRALRLAGLKPLPKLHLEMIICQTFIDEGKRRMAIRSSNIIQQHLHDLDICDTEKASFFSQLGRINFFLGRYPLAGRLFQESYKLYYQLKNWHEAARSAYNAGSSYFSAGGKMQEQAFPLVEDSRRISELHNLQGPLSHVEAFYGHNDYWHGDFAGAREHYRRAHKYIPLSDQSFRTLHVLSMLTFIYLRTGQFLTAKKFGEKTLALAEKDQSHRFRARYHNLNAELMWEEGRIEESQTFLREKVREIFSQGVNTLEELSILSRFYEQAAYLREDINTSKISIAEQLMRNTGDWVEYLHSKARLELASRRPLRAREIFKECLQKAKTYGDKYHVCLSLLGLIQIDFVSQTNSSDIEKLVQEFEISMATIVETPIKAHIFFIRAALAYRKGDIDAVRLNLQLAASYNKTRFIDRYVCETWLATLQGNIVRSTALWQRRVVSELTWVYFSPSLEVVEKGRYCISKQYSVDLRQHPALNDLLEYLLQRHEYQAKPEDVQRDVWRQSIKQQGWAQKIRNSITRLRHLVPYTIAPLIIHEDNISLNAEAITISSHLRKESDPKDEILRLLREGPLSTVHLTNRLQVSSATIKRLLKKLSDEEAISMTKVGRQVFYQSVEKQ